MCNIFLVILLEIHTLKIIIRSVPVKKKVLFHPTTVFRLYLKKLETKIWYLTLRVVRHLCERNCVC